MKKILIACVALGPFLAGCARAPVMRAASTGEDAQLASILAGRPNLEVNYVHGCAAYPENAERYGYETPLICAVINGHYSAAKMLLEAGANINALDHGKNNAMYHAKKLGRKNIEALLISKGAPAAPASAAPSAPAPASGGVTREEMRQMMEEVARRPAAPVSQSLHSDVDVPKYKNGQRPQDFAVVMGVEKYVDLPEAQFAERDAAAVHAHLLALGYPERNIVVLTGERASRSGLVKHLETWLPQVVKEDSTVFFYFSGHGAPDPKTSQAYLIPRDGDPAFLEDTAYPMKRLYARLGKLKAKRIVVALDACFSGMGDRSVLAKGTRPLVGRVDAGNVEGNMISFAASDAAQISGTLAEQGHGLFTYYLLKGLNGGAGKNGQVTAKSLHDYLVPHVQDEARRQNRVQTPQLMGTSTAFILR